MREVIAYLAPVVMSVIAFVLGRKKTKEELKKLELENLDSVVKFYKQTFHDLEARLARVSGECTNLSNEIAILRQENVLLKQEIHELNIKLKGYTNI